jgi:type II secretory pathway pseudopilin PulG
MIIVLGIIAILSAVLLPVASGYLTQSRLNTQNSNARVIFNSLQTIMQEYEFSERAAKESLFYGTDRTGETFFYCEAGTISKCWSDKKGDLNTADIGAFLSSARPETLGSRMSRLYTGYEETVWCALIKNYTVSGVVCSTENYSKYMGGYPMKGSDRSTFTGKSGSWSSGEYITSFNNVATMEAYCTAAGT